MKYKQSKPCSLMFMAIVLFIGCTKAQKSFYAYKVDSYTFGKTQKMLFTSRVISCGDYLLEFNMRENNHATAFAKDGNVEVVDNVRSYDTLSVYLLTPDGQYFNFDTFALGGKLLGQGPMAQKPNGLKFGMPLAADSTTAGKSPFKFTEPADTIINNIRCYYSDLVQDDQSAVDKGSFRYYLIKDNNFATLYKMLGLKWTNGSDYAVVGIQYYQTQLGEGFTEKIVDLRPVTAVERKICESLIQKAGLPLPK